MADPFIVMVQSDGRRWDAVVAMLIARFGDQVFTAQDIDALLATNKVALVGEQRGDDGQMCLRIRLVDQAVADEAQRLHNKLRGGMN